MIADEEGKPLTKSKGTGKTVSEINNLEKYGRSTALKVKEWINEEKTFIPETELD